MPQIPNPAASALASFIENPRGLDPLRCLLAYFPHINGESLTNLFRFSTPGNTRVASRVYNWVHYNGVPMWAAEHVARFAENPNYIVPVTFSPPGTESAPATAPAPRRVVRRPASPAEKPAAKPATQRTAQPNQQLLHILERNLISAASAALKFLERKTGAKDRLKHARELKRALFLRRVAVEPELLDKAMKACVESARA